MGETGRLLNIDIYDRKYESNGTSKAKRLRCFWEKEDDPSAGRLLKGMVEYALELAEIKAEQLGEGKPPKDSIAYQKSWRAVQRLLGNSVTSNPAEITEDDFLKQTFKTLSFNKLPIESRLLPLIVSRFKEAEKCYNAGANLSAVILSGSILEGVLLGLCQAHPQKFNTAKAAPKHKDGKAKPFTEWKLAELIGVACEVGALKHDVRKFSDNLRDFRNYIHPYEQLATGFSPDKHTAEICLTVLKAAISQITEWGRK